MENEGAALAGGPNPNIKVEGDTNAPHPDLQARAPTLHDPKLLARALRIYVTRRRRKMSDKACAFEEDEQRHRRKQEARLDDILLDGITIRRIESLVRRLEFVEGVQR